jgi:hypothetical protein
VSWHLPFAWTFIILDRLLTRDLAVGSFCRCDENSFSLSYIMHQQAAIESQRPAESISGEEEMMAM